MSQTLLSGPELAAAMIIGTRVVRGADWVWGQIDGPPPSEGTVSKRLREDGWISVRWDTGSEYSHRMGYNGKYDLKIAYPLPVQQQDSLFDSVKQNDCKLTVSCSYCNEAFNVKCLSSHEQKCLDKPIRCPTCSDVVALRDWFDHECQTARVKASEKLADDLSDILQKEECSDITIKVKNKEFHLHWNILAGRNPYFNSMFKTEMKEKSTGIVSIDDCDPDIFHSFIYFVYTGKTRELSEENVCALYEVADKYQEDQLKAECLCFMKNKISVDSCCDFIVLALRHDEKELLKSATEFFCSKTNEIIKSVKWQTFMREYPTQANELYIKSFECNAK